MFDTQLSVTSGSGFTEDSLNADACSDKEVAISDDSTASDSAKVEQETARNTHSILRQGTSSENLQESEGSDTENDELNTVKQKCSPQSSHSSLDRERQEDLDISNT